MPVRTDRCPNCWASLPDNPEDFCAHCRQSLVPPGRKARREAEEARRSGSGGAPAQPPAPAAPPRRDDEPFTGTWRSVPIDSLPAGDDLPWPSDDLPWPTDAPDARPAQAGVEGALASPAAGSASPDEPAAAGPVSPGRRRPVKRYVVAAACIIVGVAAVVTAATVLDAGNGILSNQAAQPRQPVVHRGSGFSVRFPGPPRVREVNRDGLTITTHRYEDGDSATEVTVFQPAGGVPMDLEAALRDLKADLGGTQIAVPVDVAGRAGHDVEITNAEDGRATAFVRLILDGSTLYQILTVVDGDLIDAPADHRGAVGSFVIR